MPTRTYEQNFEKMDLLSATSSRCVLIHPLPENANKDPKPHIPACQEPLTVYSTMYYPGREFIDETGY
jgi:hypothetical protein